MTRRRPVPASERPRNPKRLPALIPSGAVLSALKVVRFPSFPPFLIVGAAHNTRSGVYAVPPGAFWEIRHPGMSMKEAEQLERQQGASFLTGSTLTLKVPGYRPAALSICTVRTLRETLEALGQYEGEPPMFENDLRREQSA